MCHIGSITGLWFLPDRPLGLNTNYDDIKDGIKYEGKNVHFISVGGAEGRIPLGRPRRRWVDIRMDLQDVGCGYMDWIGLAQDRDRWRTLVSAAMNLGVP